MKEILKPMSVTVESVLKMTSKSVSVDFTSVPFCEPQYVDSKSSERSVEVNICRYAVKTQSYLYVSLFIV